MTKKSSGSILLLLVMITSLLMTISLACWYKMSLLADLIQEREAGAQNFYASEILFEEALIFAKQKFDLLMRKEIIDQMPLTFTLTPPPLLEKKGIIGQLIITHHAQHHQTLQLMIIMKKQNQISYTTRGLLFRKKPLGDSHEQNNDIFELHHVTFGRAF